MDIFGSFFRRRKPVDTMADLQRQQENVITFTPTMPIGWLNPEKADATADRIIEMMKSDGHELKDGARSEIALAVISHPWDVGAIMRQVMPASKEQAE